MPTQNLQVTLRELDSSAERFSEQLDELVSWPDQDEKNVQHTVEEILLAVKQEGDQAVLRYTQRFDCLDVQSVTDLEIDKARQQRCLDTIDSLDREALQEAARRVRRFHEKQVQTSWSYKEDNGTVLGQQLTALDRVGIYVPGGKASYPSSVLMNAIPAKVAGVEEIIMTVPSPNGELSDLVVAAAMIAGVDRIFTLGGAQAVAALAFGTETIPAVDKIVGPGNVYVAEAKRQVFGRVGIDMVA
ncbi:MAG: histidinol dehydrogenase, partial [Moraxellaceae bacterium]